MSRVRSNFEHNGYEAYTADHAHVQERDTWTGLYDHNGAPLHRQREPIGFDPHRWDQPKSKRKAKRA